MKNKKKKIKTKKKLKAVKYNRKDNYITTLQILRNMETTTMETMITTTETTVTTTKTMKWIIRIKMTNSTTTIIIIMMIKIKMLIMITPKTKISQRLICSVIKIKLLSIEPSNILSQKTL
jgi:hypothetical protein